MGQNSKFTRVYLSDPGVNLPICKYTPVCICVCMRHLLTPSKICTPEYIYTCVFLAHANWTLDNSIFICIQLLYTFMTWMTAQYNLSHFLVFVSETLTTFQKL